MPMSPEQQALANAQRAAKANMAANIDTQKMYRAVSGVVKKGAKVDPRTGKTFKPGRDLSKITDVQNVAAMMRSQRRRAR